MNNLHIFNKEKWEALPPLAKRIITDGYVRYHAHDAESTYANTRKFGELIKSGEIEPVQPDAEMLAALHKHQAAEIDAMLSNPPAGVDAPQAAIDLFKGLVAKWRKIVSEELKIPDVPANAAEVADAWMIDYDFKPFRNRLIAELTKAMAE